MGSSWWRVDASLSLAMGTRGVSGLILDMVTEGSCLSSVVGALLIVAEDGTSQTVNLLTSSSVGCESMLIGMWAPEEVRPEKTEVV